MPEQSNTPEEREFADWMLHPVTKRLLVAAERRRENLKEQWASGSFTDVHRYGTAIVNAKAIGRVQELDWIVQLEFVDLYEELESGLRPE